MYRLLYLVKIKVKFGHLHDTLLSYILMSILYTSFIQGEVKIFGKTTPLKLLVFVT